MTSERFTVTVGMDVVGSDGDHIGRVKEVRADDFLVDRPMRRDVYMPFSAIADVSGNVVRINVPAGQVDQMGWPTPAVTPREPYTGWPGVP